MCGPIDVHVRQRPDRPCAGQTTERSAFANSHRPKAWRLHPSSRLPFGNQSPECLTAGSLSRDRPKSSALHLQQFGGRPNRARECRRSISNVPKPCSSRPDLAYAASPDAQHQAVAVHVASGHPGKSRLFIWCGPHDLERVVRPTCTGPRLPTLSALSTLSLRVSAPCGRALRVAAGAPRAALRLLGVCPIRLRSRACPSQATTSVASDVSVASDGARNTPAATDTNI